MSAELEVRHEALEKRRVGLEFIKSGFLNLELAKRAGDDFIDILN